MPVSSHCPWLQKFWIALKWLQLSWQYGNATGNYFVKYFCEFQVINLIDWPDEVGLCGWMDGCEMISNLSDRVNWLMGYSPALSHPNKTTFYLVIRSRRWAASLQPQIPRLVPPAHPAPTLLHHSSLSSPIFPVVTYIYPCRTAVWLMRPLLIMASGTGVSALSLDAIRPVLLQRRKTLGRQTGCTVCRYGHR